MSCLNVHKNPERTKTLSRWLTPFTPRVRTLMPGERTFRQLAMLAPLLWRISANLQMFVLASKTNNWHKTHPMLSPKNEHLAKNPLKTRHVFVPFIQTGIPYLYRPEARKRATLHPPKKGLTTVLTSAVRICSALRRFWLRPDLSA